MGAVVFEVPPTEWACPFCQFQQVTRDPRFITPMHSCSGQRGLSMPMLKASEMSEKTARLVLLEREDYMGSEVGADRVMSVKTERADGSNDLHVLAPVATVNVRVD